MDLSEHLPEHEIEIRMLRKCEVSQQGRSTYIQDNQMLEGRY